MQCPKCERGIIINIRLRKGNAPASLCNACDTLWLEGEMIGSTTGHAVASFTGVDDLEYTIEEILEQDQEHQSADYVDYK